MAHNSSFDHIIDSHNFVVTYITLKIFQCGMLSYVNFNTKGNLLVIDLFTNMPGFLWESSLTNGKGLLLIFDCRIIESKTMI